MFCQLMYLYMKYIIVLPVIWDLFEIHVSRLGYLVGQQGTTWNKYLNRPLMSPANLVFEYPKKGSMSLWATVANTKRSTYIHSGWWFRTFFIFPNSWDDDPIWLIFFQGVGQPAFVMGYFLFSPGGNGGTLQSNPVLDWTNPVI